MAFLRSALILLLETILNRFSRGSKEVKIEELFLRSDNRKHNMNHPERYRELVEDYEEQPFRMARNHMFYDMDYLVIFLVGLGSGIVILQIIGWILTFVKEVLLLSLPAHPLDGPQGITLIHILALMFVI
jgi:hypothetical protein